MNRNVTIVIVILILVVIAGYLVWLRSRYQPPISPQPVSSPEITATPAASPTQEATPTATPGAKEATPTTKLKDSTPGATTR